MLLFTVACSKGEVREEGRRGLVRPVEDSVMGWDEKARQLPDFPAMLHDLYKRVKIFKFNFEIHS